MNNDLISREALKEAIRKRQWHIDDIEEVEQIIDNAPTVDLKDIYQEGHYDGQLEGYTRAINEERPLGEWGKWVVSEIRCPKCLEYYDPDCYSKEELNKCPNCGADMRGDSK